MFVAAALPHTIFPPLFNRYEGGGEFGLHVDNAIRQARGGVEPDPVQAAGICELAGAEVELVGEARRERRLKDALSLVEADYDFILIDCPPSLSMLTLNGLCSAHGVIVPMQCEYFALEGLSDLVNSIKQPLWQRASQPPSNGDH